VHTIWSASLKGRDHSVGLGIDGRIKLRQILEEQSGKLWIGFIWLRIRISGGGLVNTVMNFRVT
jgi:hypothetical protein